MQVQRKRKGRENIADFRVGYFPEVALDLEAGAGGGRLVSFNRPAPVVWRTR